MRVAVAVIILGLSAFFAGCSETAPKPAARDSAIQDPMNYNPAAKREDISGGGIMDLDRKALRKDINNVLNP